MYNAHRNTIARCQTKSIHRRHFKVIFTFVFLRTSANRALRSRRLGLREFAIETIRRPADRITLTFCKNTVQRCWNLKSRSSVARLFLKKNAREDAYHTVFRTRLRIKTVPIMVRTSPCARRTKYWHRFDFIGARLSLVYITGCQRIFKFVFFTEYPWIFFFWECFWKMSKKTKVLSSKGTSPVQCRIPKV